MKFLPLSLILIGLGSFFYLHLYHVFTFEYLEIHRDLLLAWTSAHYMQSVIIYIVLFIVCEAVAIPAATFFTLVGGFLFGTGWGALYAVLSATIGGTILFVIIKFSLADWVEKKAAQWIKKM